MNTADAMLWISPRTMVTLRTSPAMEVTSWMAVPVVSVANLFKDILLVCLLSRKVSNRMKWIEGDDHTCTEDMILQKCILLNRDSLPHLQIAKWIFFSIKRPEYFHIYYSSLAVSDLLFSLILSMIFNVKWPCSPQNMVKREEKYPCIDFACIMSWHWTSRIISRLKTFFIGLISDDLTFFWALNIQLI